MTSKYILCFAVLIAAIEAFPQPRYIAFPIEEYEALINGHTEPQSHSLRLAATSLSRHKRSSTRFTPIKPSQQQYQSYSEPQYVQMQPYSYEPQASEIQEVAVKPTYGAYKQQYRSRLQPYAASRLNEPLRSEASEIKEVAVEHKRHNYGAYKQQYRPRPQQYPASHPNEVVFEQPPLRPFNGRYDGTPQFNPGQVKVIYVGEDPSDEYPGDLDQRYVEKAPSDEYSGDLDQRYVEKAPSDEYSGDLDQRYTKEDPSYENSGDLDQGASNTHEKRHGVTGDDHVDYGAYTGKDGAFGWYSDHPVLVY